MAAVEGAAVRRIGEFQRQNLANISWAFATARVAAPRLFSAVAKAAAVELPPRGSLADRPQELSNTMCGPPLATHPWTSDSWMCWPGGPLVPPTGSTPPEKAHGWMRRGHGPGRAWVGAPGGARMDGCAVVRGRAGWV